MTWTLKLPSREDRILIVGLGPGEPATTTAARFVPRLLEPLGRIAFPISFQGRQLRVASTPVGASREPLPGSAPKIARRAMPLTLTVEAPMERPIPAPALLPSPRQPSGRAPARRDGSST